MSKGPNKVSTARKSCSILRPPRILTNGTLDIMFNLDAQVVKHVQDDNDGVVAADKGKVYS